MAKGREKQTIKDIGGEKGREIGLQQDFATKLKPIRAGYQDFSTTGGVSPATQTEIKGDVTNRLSGLYGDLRNRLAQNRAIQGGYSPGYGANLAELGRNQSQAQASGMLETDIGIQDLIRKGKLAGLGGMSDVAGLNLANIQGTGAGVRGLLGTQAGLAARPGIFDNIMQVAQLASQSKRNQQQSGGGYN